MNKNQGNMYEFVKTRNFIGGACIYRCRYCYVEFMKRRNSVIAKKYSGKPFLAENEFKKGLGKGNTWFIGSMIDMFAENISDLFIHKVLSKCLNYDNTYFFQSKNPRRFLDFNFPPDTIFCTTVESNRIYHGITKAPSIKERIDGINEVSAIKGKPIHVTIEPIMDFDLDRFVTMIKWVNPNQVNIGADSKQSDLPEPSGDKIGFLIGELKKFTRVHLKKNLKRLYVNS